MPSAIAPPRAHSLRHLLQGAVGRKWAVVEGKMVVVAERQQAERENHLQAAHELLRRLLLQLQQPPATELELERQTVRMELWAVWVGCQATLVEWHPVQGGR